MFTCVRSHCKHSCDFSIKQIFMRDISTLKARILQYLDYKGISKYECYKNTGMTNSVLSQKNGMSEENIFKFLSHYKDINPTWFLLGEGEMLKKETHEEGIIGYKMQPPARSGYIAVPLVEIEVAAGFGSTNTNYIDESNLLYIPTTLLHNSGERLCINIVGESMMPTLSEGTHVIVRRLRRAEWENGILNNHIYVITTRNGESYIKRVKNRLKTEGVITLVSDNQNQRKYKPFDLSAEELHHIWTTELFIAENVGNCADNVTTDNDLSELRKKVAQLTTIVTELVQKVDK